VDQVSPLSVERKPPPPKVPANRLVPLTASLKMYELVKPLLTAVQWAPSSVDRNTPPTGAVPANRLVPLTASAWTIKVVSPVLTAVQLSPLSVERNTPPPFVAANRLAPMTANAETPTPAGKPLL